MGKNVSITLKVNSEIKSNADDLWEVNGYMKYRKKDLNVGFNTEELASDTNVGDKTGFYVVAVLTLISLFSIMLIPLSIIYKEMFNSPIIFIVYFLSFFYLLFGLL